MKPILLLSALIAALVSFSGGCSTKVSVDANTLAPQKVGEYERSFPPQPFGQLYTTKYKKPDTELNYAFGSFKTDLEAQKLFTVTRCSFPEVSDQIPHEVMQETALKNKTGEEIGKIRVCRLKKDVLGTVVGDYMYAIVLTNGVYLTSVSTLKGTLADAAGFVETLPFNSQIDLGSDLQNLIAKRSSAGMSASDLMKMEFPVKVTKEPYINGKILIVKESPATVSQTAESRPAPSFGTASEYYRVKDLIAESYDEAQTIVKIACVKGAKMADYVSKDELKLKFPAYSVNCKVSLIDRSIPAVIMQKDLLGTFVIEERSFSPNDKEVRATLPNQTIEDLLLQLPRR